MDPIDHLKQQLGELLLLLQSLTCAQIQGLCQIIIPDFASRADSAPPDSPGKPLSAVDLTAPFTLPLDTLTPPEVLHLLHFSNSLSFTDNDPLLASYLASPSLPDAPTDVRPLPQKDVLQFAQLYGLLLVQTLLKDTSLSQFYKFLELTSEISTSHDRLLLLSHLQELFSRISSDTLSSLHSEFSELLKRPSECPDMNASIVHVISSSLAIPSEQFYLYGPVSVLLNLPLEELEGLQSGFVGWDALKLRLFDRLIEIGRNHMNDIGDIFLLLVPSKFPVEKSNNGIGVSTVKLEIVEQPPEKCVYKRNVKPPPSIVIVGDAPEGFLFVSPVLVRCDTYEEVNNLLEGGQPVKITSNRSVIFKRLKILSTSHQLNETLFTLKFELRRYESVNSDKYELLHAVTSKPICVVSHSTQLKPNDRSSLPIVIEVIPFSGPPEGATKVAILGSNFVESPTMLVKFDNTPVKPLYHGPRTLICTTPQHAPGTVSVKVCNDFNKWSETEATFTYYGAIRHQEDNLRTSVVFKQDFNIDHYMMNDNIINRSYSPGGTTNNFYDSFGMPSFGDNTGFSVLHHIAAEGNYPLLVEALNSYPDNQEDKFGNVPLHWAIRNNQLKIVQHFITNNSDLLLHTNRDGEAPLHWAVENGNLDMIEELINAGSPLDIQNDEGLTPVHLALREGSPEVLGLLLRRGARLDLPDIDGIYPLHLAVEMQRMDLIALLLEHSWMLDCQDDDGETPLHWAVRMNSLPIIQYLIQKGADLLRGNDEGETPLCLAQSIGHWELIPVLSGIQGRKPEMIPMNPKALMLSPGLKLLNPRQILSLSIPLPVIPDPIPDEQVVEKDPSGAFVKTMSQEDINLKRPRGLPTDATADSPTDSPTDSPPLSPHRDQIPPAILDFIFPFEFGLDFEIGDFIQIPTSVLVI